MMSNIKLSRDQKAVIIARNRTLGTQISNSKLQAERNEEVDSDQVPQPEDTRTFAEVEFDEVAKRQQLNIFCNKLLQDNQQAYSLAGQIRANGLMDYCLRSYSSIFKEVNDKRSIKTAAEALIIITRMPQQD